VGFDCGVVLVHIPTVTWPFHGKFGTTLEIQKTKRGYKILETRSNTRGLPDSPPFTTKIKNKD